MIISTSNLLKEKLFLLQEKADYEKYYADKMDKKVFDYLISLDPTKKKNFETWILNNYLKLKPNEQERIIREDGYKIKDALTLYSKGQSAGIVKNPYSNIKYFETFRDLYKYLKENKEQFSQYLDQETESSEDGLIRGKDYILLYEDKDWHVVDTLTWKANCHFGANTEWCTTDPNSSSTFEDYKKESPIVIINYKGNKYQLHEDSEQYMDRDDRPFNTTELGLKMPKKLQRILFKKGFSLFDPNALGIFKKIEKLTLNTLRKLLKETKIDGTELLYYIDESDNPKLDYYLNDFILRLAYSDYADIYDTNLPWWETNPSDYIDEEPAINPDDPYNITSYDDDQITKIEETYHEKEGDEIASIIDYDLMEINKINFKRFNESMYVNILSNYVYLLQEDFSKVSQEEIKNEILWLLKDVMPKYEIEISNNSEFLYDMVNLYNKIMSEKE